ncbi:MAG: SPASM domain-containing protein [Lachnospiraceae bacterium]|nr:SPASM domain-containing protein [Lachnospiraceae bacterium]
MKKINLLIKPVSGLCNMDCRYCFYKKEISRCQTVRPEIMSREMSELLAKRICEDAYDEIHITFQGGEPTLAGLNYYQEFLEIVNRYRKRGQKISFSLQTNGLLIDASWAEFFRKNHFLIGLSYDGTDFLHDRYRKTSDGKSTSDQVKNAWQSLRSYGVETNLLCVVTKQAAKKPERLYQNMKQMGGQYLQFIPCIGETDLYPEWCLTEELYCYFLKTVFDMWYLDWKKGAYVSIRQFDDFVHLMCGHHPSNCAACGNCGGYLVIENDGSAFPCDFYVEDAWYLGNIQKLSLEQLLLSQKMLRFKGNKVLPEECSQCQYYRLCMGGCKNDYLVENKTIRNRFCRAFRNFFDYAGSRIAEISKIEMQYEVRNNESIIY